MRSFFHLGIDMEYSEVVNVLIDKRKSNKINSRALAQIIGVADTLVSKWETGESIPNAINFFNWCEALEVDIVFNVSVQLAEYEPSNQTVDWINKNYIEVNISYERDKFVDYYIGKGITAKDWDAMFRNWVRRADEFQRQRVSNNQKQIKTSSDFVQERRKRILSIGNVQVGIPRKDNEE